MYHTVCTTIRLGMAKNDKVHFVLHTDRQTQTGTHNMDIHMCTFKHTQFALQSVLAWQRMIKYISYYTHRQTDRQTHNMDIHMYTFEHTQFAPAIQS
jgi:hypothetical protein